MEEKEISIETMTGIGKEVEIAGRKYLILPVNIRDMHLVIGEEHPENNILIVNKSVLDEEGENSLSWQAFGLNIIDENRKKSFLHILNKYVFYLSGNAKIPMTEKLLEEHGWSFKEIAKFLYTWTEISD